MITPLNIDEMLMSTRGRVYLLWAFLSSGGFLATHYNQIQKVNGLWLVLSIIGLGYMYKVMPLQVKQMRLIFLSWLVPITFGMVVSIAVFYVDNIGFIIEYLGIFWLIVLAVAYFWNGLVDKPVKVYFFASVLNGVVGLLALSSDALLRQQYLLAAIVSAWSMLNLWIFRSS